jgi:hypothetical protein
MNTKENITQDFDWEYYTKNYTDLKNAGITTEQQALEHYILHGYQEKRHKKEESLSIEIDEDFDAEFYLSEYPDVKDYNKHAIHINLRDKLFHHYINYGKAEGRFKNKEQQKKSFFVSTNEISLNIDIKNLICPINKLECLCLLTTSKEINNNKYNIFISNLVKTISTNISKNIDFYIVINNSNFDKEKLNINNLYKIFNDVCVTNLNIHPSEDIYLNKYDLKNDLPKYGLKSGPNICFFQSIKLLNKYNTTLFIETDCLLNEEWLTNIDSYTKSVNGFLISGATYSGDVFTKAGSAMITHINGGSALYATGNNILQEFIFYADAFLQKQIKKDMPGLAYDYAIKLLIDYQLNNSYNKTNEREIWKFINRNYLPCNFIVNCSTSLDSNIDLNILKQKYNYSIVHKK